MEDLTNLLRQYGTERKLSPGEVLCRQGSASDFAFYLTAGRLGCYREEGGVAYLLSEIGPGSLVGEMGAATGWSRSATVKAEEASWVIEISDADFRRAMREAPALAARVVSEVGERLTSADVARVTLGRSYQQAADRVEVLSSEKAQLEELLRLREELAYMIVHDLRNPLGVLSSGLELLTREIGERLEPELEYEETLLGTMERSVRRMQRLVDTLLDISRLEEGEMTLILVPIDVRLLIQDAVAEELPLAQNHGVLLTWEAPEDLPAALADRDVTFRVLINLIDNALKFTPRGKPVSVAAHAQGSEVRVAVIDQGPGIPPAERERVFEKFTQVRGQMGRRRGSGLGLTFCRMAVEAHGGRIWVEAGPGGEGSRFVFTLPQGFRPERSEGSE